MVDSSPSSFSQRKHSKPTRIYSPLWPTNASNGSITLHHDQYSTTVSFKTASTTETKPTIQNPAVPIGCSGSVLMPPGAHSISADRPDAPDISPSALQELLESVQGTVVGCLCLGDFFLHDNGLRNGAERGAMSLHPTRSVSLNTLL